MNRIDRMEMELAAIARGEAVERQRRRQAAVVVPRDELRRQADAALKAYAGKIKIAPADETRSPTYKKRPCNPWK